ncbi:MAG: pyrroline-5-carboxylate reductase [Spirochaetales bacterium]|nr:pyrroline-5-carboxylate reductase [Leptospiraceae bacterium]MCP5480821.1 pyrroline-5-carboxylate reductase [Spirochaetales bacterium]
MSESSTKASHDSLGGLRPGLLGTGKMGGAILRGLTAHSPGLELFAFDPAPVDSLSREIPHLQFCASAAELEERADPIIICVKPGDLGAALAGLKGTGRFVSIAAGVSLARLRRFFPNEGRQISRLARVMPNISATVGRSVSAIYAEETDFAQTCTGIFGAIGTTVLVHSEKLLHAVTGLSGSGPAYVFAFLQALAEGGVQAGLDYNTALEMARDTIAGAVELIRRQPEHPDVWRNRVTSPGGTTIAGLAALEEGAFHAVVMEAVRRASERSAELGRD